MIEIFIVFLFALSLSALAHPDYIFIFITLLSSYITLIKIRNKPDNISIIWFFGLAILYILGVIGQLGKDDFKLFTSFIYFTPQFGLIIGSILSTKYVLYKNDFKLFIKKATINLKENIFAKRLLYFLTLTIILAPLLGIILGIIFNPFNLQFSFFSFPALLQGAIGYRLKSPDAVGFSYESETLNIWPRLILSKAAITFSVLVLNSINWIFLKKRFATFFNVIFIFVFSGFRSGLFGLTIQLISAILIENRRFKLNFVKLVIGILLSSFFLIPFTLIFFDTETANQLYDRMPSFKAALDYSLNLNFFGATFGSYWKYTLENNTFLTSKFGGYQNEVYIGTEHLAGELLGSIGIIGFIFFSFMNITRILTNVQNYSHIRGLKKPSLMILLLQIGILTAGIGGAVNMIGVTYYILMGWSITFHKDENI